MTIAAKLPSDSNTYQSRKLYAKSKDAISRLEKKAL